MLTDAGEKETMMSIVTDVQEALKHAMKNKEQVRLDCLRMVVSPARPAISRSARSTTASRAAPRGARRWIATPWHFRTYV